MFRRQMVVALTPEKIGTLLHIAFPHIVPEGSWVVDARMDFMTREVDFVISHPDLPEIVEGTQLIRRSTLCENPGEAFKYWGTVQKLLSEAPDHGNSTPPR